MTPSTGYMTPSTGYMIPSTGFMGPSSNYVIPPNLGQPSDPSTIRPNNYVQPPPQNNSGYITLPTLANPTTTTNPFSGVITIAKDTIGYRFDPRTNFGVTFDESSSGSYVYQGFEKLKKVKSVTKLNI